MTVRPGTIKRRMDIDLPRPRTYKHIATPEYIELEKKALQIVDEEAVKAFSQLSKAGTKPTA